MKSIIFIISFFISTVGFSQLYCTNAPYGGVLSNYGTGQVEDSVYYFCTDPVLASLEVIPEGGVAGWTFDWQEYSSNSNSWTPLITESNVPVSTIDVPEGGYRVTVTDGLGEIVGCYRLWIVKVITPAIGSSLTVTATPFGCTGVQLDANFTPGTPAVTTPYYAPPAEPIYVDSSTEITVSFSAQHTYVSDLGYYLIGPASCGSPVVALSPVNYQIGLPMNCNSGNNVDSLTFNSLSTALFNVCNTPTPLSGTYGVQGNGAPIDWSPIFGCDATDPGWQVQIFDCVGLDIGFLTEANVSFTGQSVCGDTVTQNYASGPIMEPINDNACNTFAAATYTVPVAPATPVTCTPVYEWNANPYFFIADSMGGPSIIIDPAPTVATYFTYDLVQACDDPGGGACGIPGQWNNGAWFYPAPPQQLYVNGPSTLCVGDPQAQLFADIPGGIWTGPGITDPVNGIFDPSIAGVGIHTFIYDVMTQCGPLTDVVVVEVTDQASPNLSGPSQTCLNDTPLNFTSDIPGGIWSGTGITDPVNGTFDPSIAGVGNHSILYTPNSTCVGPQTIVIEVTQPSTASLNALPIICVDAGLQDFAPSISGGDWIGAGMLPTGYFNPGVAGIGIHQIGYVPPGTCTDTTWITVEVIQPVPVDVNGFAAVCLNADSLVLPDPAGNGTWSGTGVVPGNIFVPSMAGEGIFNLSYDVPANCTAPGTYTVEVLPVPPSAFTSDITESCAPGEFLLSPTNQNQLWNYDWSVNGNNYNGGTYTLNNAGVGTYSISLTVTDANGCSTTTEKIDYLIVHDSPVAEFSTSAVSFYNTTVDFTNLSSGATNYNWNFAGLGNSTETNPTFTFPNATAGDYEVCLIATNAFGCIDSTCAHIIIEQNGTCYAPNSFSPNGDSKNEIFLPILSGYATDSYSLSIYNRWGEQLFQTNDINRGWDGTHEGSLVQDGVYIWKISAIEISTDLPIELTGHVTLIK
ncbi:gliding motility-associated C-terminal domain-containing protein [Paracrocinitomix mangrovi]|uniref:T9SS type B sorting domain-containing protein n=1 Tax=Paracrocinitomix mangrovi TaxID=2862509 RepID=UPI001C8E842C|nr:gliding motility-associated C-terminal domain-containing protein [Paracrocinitomix mangrovi]UKN03552.1 gliding motility-associated C-terminal domain-containing protein [Paracrocinitomix mangrovi]